MIRLNSITRPSSTHLLVLILLIVFSGCSESIPIDEPVTENVRVPLNDPSLFYYNGQASGLYPWGNALDDNDYKNAYMDACAAVHPKNAAGENSDDGKTVLLAIGGSTPGIMYNGLISAQSHEPGFGEDLVTINAGMNGKDLSELRNPGDSYWSDVDELLSGSGVTAQQVEVIFCIEDNLKITDTTFTRVDSVKLSYIAVLEVIREKFPNCKLFYVGDRGYTGYATDPQHYEPIGYLNGWSVKYLVQDYIDGAINSTPVVTWLDYYWANGTTPRWDGLQYLLSDFAEPDYIHLHQFKADELMMGTHQRLRNDAGAQLWYK